MAIVIGLACSGETRKEFMVLKCWQQANNIASIKNPDCLVPRLYVFSDIISGGTLQSSFGNSFLML